MKNSQRGFIVPLLLVLIALLLIGGGTYVYTQKKSATGDASTTQTTIVSTNSQPNLPVAATILSDTHTTLTDYEKSLVNRISSTYSSDNSYILKYYDDKTVVFYTITVKGSDLGIYDIETLKRLSTSYPPVGGNTGSNSYIIGVAWGKPDHFVFYKKGSTDFQTVPNSILLSSETYAKKWEGMSVYAYDFTFDEPTKTLTSSVFKPNPDQYSPNTKIRTVKFVLP